MHAQYCSSNRYVTEVLLLEQDVERKIQAQFVARQLFSMFSVLDLSGDEVGRSDTYFTCA